MHELGLIDIDAVEGPQLSEGLDTNGQVFHGVKIRKTTGTGANRPISTPCSPLNLLSDLNTRQVGKGK